jgi:hypothetical protein
LQVLPSLWLLLLVYLVRVRHYLDR